MTPLEQIGRCHRYRKYASAERTLPLLQLAEMPVVRSENLAWETLRNDQHDTVDLRFTTAKARLKCNILTRQNHDGGVLVRLNETHENYGLSLCEVAQLSNLDPTFIHYILRGARRPNRDVIIALGFAYTLERIEVDEFLLLADLPPLGRSALREYRKMNGCLRSSK